MAPRKPQKAVTSLLELHKLLTQKLQEVNTVITTAKDHNKGEKGDPGYTPQLGKDYLTPDEIKAFADFIIANVKIPLPKDGAPGKDAVVDENKIADLVLKKMDLDKVSKLVLKKIKQPEDGKDAIVNIDDIVKQIVSLPKEKGLKIKELAGWQETQAEFLGMVRETGRQYLHGGGDTVVAGANVTITNGPNGTKIINSTGGGTVTSFLLLSNGVDKILLSDGTSRLLLS